MSLLTVLFWTVSIEAAHISTTPADFPNITWTDLLQGTMLTFPVKSGVLRYNLKYEKADVNFSQCKIPTGLTGVCRPLHDCPKPEFLRSFKTFMLFHCLVDRESIGVCCPDGNSTERSAIPIYERFSFQRYNASDRQLNSDQPSNSSVTVIKRRNNLFRIPPDSGAVPIPTASQTSAKSRLVSLNPRFPPKSNDTAKVVNIFVVLPDANQEVYVNVTEIQPAPKRNYKNIRG